jgi:hypothetical protein
LALNSFKIVFLFSASAASKGLFICMNLVACNFK